MREEQQVGGKIGQSVLTAVSDLLPVLRERAQETEDARDVSAETIQALEEAGFFRLLQPAGYGGLEADPLIFYQAVRLRPSASGSSGWLGPVRARQPRAPAAVPRASPEQ